MYSITIKISKDELSTNFELTRLASVKNNLGIFLMCVFLFRFCYCLNRFSVKCEVPHILGSHDKSIFSFFEIDLDIRNMQAI